MNLKDQEKEEKLRGGYYTPPAIAEFLSRWGMQRGPRSILEPSCGDGAFIKALDEVSYTLDGVDFHGVEYDAAEARKSGEEFSRIEGKGCSGTGVRTGDFFEFAEEERDGVLRGGVELVIGNPPYIRYQYFEHGRDIAEKRLKKLGIKTTKHANAWLHFLAESVSTLAEDGRIAMVIPGELLHVTYSSDLRRWLTEQLTSITIITFETLVFPNVQQEVVLFLGEKRSGSRKKTMKLIQLRDVTELSQSVVRHINKKAPRVIKDQDKWTCYFLEGSEVEFYHEISERLGERRFKEIASIDIGIVTGANNFFCVSKTEMIENELAENRHLRILPMLGRSNEVDGLEFTRDDFERNLEWGKKCNMLIFNKESSKESLNEELRRYIESGEEMDLQKRYKCRIRDPWFWIPSVYPSELSMFKRASEFTRLIHNPTKAHTTDTVYRVQCLENDDGVIAKHLAFSFVNSLTFLSCELEGRSYGGGVLELVPGEVERVLLPVYKCTESEFKTLDGMLRKKTPIDEILDYTDSKIFDGRLDSRSLSKIRGSWRKLQQRREVRGKSKV